MNLEGFQFLRTEDRRRTQQAAAQREPLATLSKGGFLIFNFSASRFLEGYVAAQVGYNPKENLLAVIPKRHHHPRLNTVKLSRMGPNKRSRSISFKFFSKEWGIAMDGSAHPVRWDPNTEVMIINLNETRSVYKRKTT